MISYKRNWICFQSAHEQSRKKREGKRERAVDRILHIHFKWAKFLSSYQCVGAPYACYFALFLFHDSFVSHSIRYFFLHSFNDIMLKNRVLASIHRYFHTISRIYIKCSMFMSIYIYRYYGLYSAMRFQYFLLLVVIVWMNGNNFTRIHGEVSFV